jgi:hypothetical protein
MLCATASRLAGRTAAAPDEDHAASLRRGFVLAALFANAIGPTWLLPDSTPLVAVPFVVIVLPLLVVRSTRRLRPLAGALGALLCALAVASSSLEAWSCCLEACSSWPPRRCRAMAPVTAAGASGSGR